MVKLETNGELLLCKNKTKLDNILHGVTIKNANS